MVSMSNFWGTGRNAADNIPRIGLKTQNIEREIAAQVAQEMKEKAEAEER